MSIHPQPNWVIGGGCCLAFLGAAANACYLIHFGTSVSHLTGDISKVAMDAVAGHNHLSWAAVHLLTAACGFLLGATSAGFFIHHPGIEFTRPYGRAITAIGLCLMAAHFTLEVVPLLSIGLAAFSCGFQNALATHYRGMVLRTTHVTGLLTDLGTHFGMFLKGHEVAAWKLFVPFLLTASFFIGALFGSILILSIHSAALLIIAVLYVGGGLSWSIYKHLLHRNSA